MHDVKISWGFIVPTEISVIMMLTEAFKGCGHASFSPKEAFSFYFSPWTWVWTVTFPPLGDDFSLEDGVGDGGLVTPKPKPQPNPKPHQPGTSGKTRKPCGSDMCFSKNRNLHPHWEGGNFRFACGRFGFSVPGNSNSPVREDCIQKKLFLVCMWF